MANRLGSLWMVVLLVMPLTVEDFLPDLERRKGGTQKGTTPRQEEDLPIFKSGLFNNKTTGAPITILFENKNIRSGDYEKQRDVPRPGHADFVAHKKFGGFEDYRGGGHFSGRLTVGIGGSRSHCKEKPLRMERASTALQSKSLLQFSKLGEKKIWKKAYKKPLMQKILLAELLNVV